MERFRIGRYPFNFQGDLLRDVVVKLNYNFSLIEDLLRQGGVSIDPDNLITINNIEKLIQVINDKISNELNYLVYVYYDGIYHFLSDIEFSDDKVNLIFEGSIIKDGKIVSSTYIITCDLDSEGNILNVTSENSKREYNISGFRVIRIRTKPLEFIDEEDLKLVGEALKDPSNSNSVELSIQDNSSTTNLIPHQSILSTIVSDNEIAHELKFITGENLITAKFTYNSNTKELIGSPSLTESLAPSSETLILSEINDIPSGGRISDENYNRLVLAIENNADIYTTDNTGLIKSVILISDTDNEIILTVKDNNLTEKNIIISKLNNLIKTEKVELATKESVDNKVDKEPGKGLSSNDYTSEEKTLVGTIINKVDKVQGKGLSTYDLTEARKNKLDSYPELTGAGNKALMDNGTFVEITGEGIIFSDIEIINIEDLQVEYVTEEIYNKIANAIINNRHIVLNSINRSDVSPFSLRAAEPINVITYSVIRQEYLNFTNRDILLVITDGTTTTEITIESTFHVTIIKRPSSISLDNSNPLPTVELTQTSIGLQANLVLAKSDSGVQLVKTEDGLVAQFKWDGEDQEIKLKYVTSQEYSSLNEIDQGTLYFITDNRYIMFQGIKYGDNISREEINDIKELLNQKVDKDGDKVLSDNNFSDEDKTNVNKIPTIESDITTIEGNISTIEGNIDTINENISTINTELDTKVDKDGSKVLSDNNYTTAEKEQVAKIATIESDLETKVDKDGSKVLSDNNYTTAEKNLVATISNKVDKIDGKSLSTNDFTNDLKTKLDELDTNAELTTKLGNKVDKVEGKSLSTNDFSNNYKSMLDNIEDTVNDNLRPATESTLGAVKLSSDFSFNSEGEIYLNKVYGIEWDTTVSDPTCTRIGDMSLHKSLPIQSKMKACLLNDNGSVNYYLNPNDWSKKITGEASNLDGTDGQVMIEIPEHYRKFEEDGNIRRCYLSEGKCTGFTKVPKVYVGAYEAALDRTNNKLASVCNETEQYRGGNNQADWDALSKSQLGKCATSMTRATMRTRARNRGYNWNEIDYESWKTIFWLYYVEYANRNCQAAVNSELTAEGYKQGGLGSGATTLASADWSAYNSYYPMLKCGASNSLASGSGEVIVNLPDDYKVDTPTTLACCRYRGIENPFGHIWTNVEGAIFDIKTDADGGTSEFYTTSDKTKFGDTLEGFTKVGDVPRKDGYVTKLIFGENGEFAPSDNGGGSTTYWCDYFYTSISSSSLRTLLLGGSCFSGATSGFGCCYSSGGVSGATASVSGRLCYLI